MVRPSDAAPYRTVPRTRGDEPVREVGGQLRDFRVLFPAHAGMNREAPDITAACNEAVFPAHAGMNRRADVSLTASSR